MVAMSDEQVQAQAEVGLRRLYQAVPRLAHPIAFRAFESHLEDLIAVTTACLKGALDWPATLVGIETAYLQARACLDDDACCEALERATALVAQRAAADLDTLSAMSEEADRRDRESAPAAAPGTGVAGSGSPSAGTTPVKPDAEAPESAPGPCATSSEASFSGVMSSAAQRSRDICPRPQDASGSRPEASTSLGVTTGKLGAPTGPSGVSGASAEAVESRAESADIEAPKPDGRRPESAPAAAPGTGVAGSAPPPTETTRGKPEAQRPESESGTGFALSVSNSKANPKVQTSYPKPKPYPKPKSEESTS